MAEKRMRNRTPAVRRDPLIDALVRRLPAEDQPFPADARSGWLKMAAMAFDVAYGPAGIDVDALKMAAMAAPQPAKETAVSEPAASNVSPLRRPTAEEIAALDEPRYYIDASGFARGPGGKRIKATEVPSTALIEDERADGARDLDTIVWADGSWPAVALPSLNIVAA